MKLHTKSKQAGLEKRVLRFIQERGLAQPQQTVVVGVSGGADSVCLLHILVKLQATLDIKLYAAHLNHLLRGAESDADAQYVIDLALRLGVPATISRRDVESYQRLHRCSLEAAAREVRYAFLAEVAASIGASRVAVGHTANDQVETILMHLVRGSGLAGLRGMQPITTWRSATSDTRLTVVRPLLETQRDETEAYCDAQELSPRIDSSNRSLAYLRNRFRSELVPLLRSYNPNIDQSLLRTAYVAVDELAFFEEQVSSLWNSLVTEEPDRLVLDSKAVASLPPALRRHLLRKVLLWLLGEQVEIESIHIESMMESLAKPAGKRLSLPGGLVFATSYNTSTLEPGATSRYPLPILEGEHPLRIPGETKLPGWLAKGSILPRQPVERMESGWKAYLDFEVAGSQLVVRGRRPGDRFQPLGMEHPKKLQDFMVDAKISRFYRNRVPIVCSPKHILWVAGWRIDERAKVSDSTERVLLLEFERI